MPIKVMYSVEHDEGSITVEDEDIENLEGDALQTRLQELVDEYARKNCYAIIAGWRRIPSVG